MNRFLFASAVFLLACTVLAVPEPEPFSKRWGNPEDLDKDCTIRRDGNALNIELPGTDHDYDPHRKQLNAPRILREIEGEFDLQVRIRIDCPPSAHSTVKGQPACVSAGLVMIFPDTYPYRSFCSRLDYGVVQQRIGIEYFPVAPFLPHQETEKEPRKGIGEDGCVLYKNWVFGVKVLENSDPLKLPRPVTINRERVQQMRPRIWDRGWRDWPMRKKAGYVYLRMEQRDKRVVLFMSPDGEKWIRLTGFMPTLPAKSKVGLAAYTTSSEPSKVRFDQIKFTQGKKKGK